MRRETEVLFVISSPWRTKSSAERGSAVIMLTSSANQYLRPEYLTPLPTTVSSLMTKLKISPLNTLDKTCFKMWLGIVVMLPMFWTIIYVNKLRLCNSQ